MRGQETGAYLETSWLEVPSARAAVRWPGWEVPEPFITWTSWTSLTVAPSLLTHWRWASKATDKPQTSPETRQGISVQDNNKNHL